MNKGKDNVCQVRPAKLSEEQLETLRQIESTLGGDICLLAVKPQTMFVLEAKIAPKIWQSIRQTYPDGHLPAWYGTRDEAEAAKATLKTLLHGKWKDTVKKYPIRIRELET